MFGRDSNPPSGDFGQDKEEPDVNEDDQQDLEDALANDVLTQEQGTVDDNQNKLEDQHDQERDRNLHTYRTHTEQSLLVVVYL